MRTAEVIGTVTATAKDEQLVGLKLLLTNIIDGDGGVLEHAIVAADTCGAGVGDRVLITYGSAARLPAKITGAPVDASIVAIIDRVSLG
jgi:ethanolamine utilization protein EutN